SAQDTLTYTVTVGTSAPPGLPVASFVVRPSPALAGQFVVNDPIGTSVPAGKPIFRWRFGDNGWPSEDPKPFHRYPLPGGYHPHLTVWDSIGQRAVADRPVKVGINSLYPPTVTITSAQPLQGSGALTATFSAQVAPGNSGQMAAYRWNLGEGTVRSGVLAVGEAVPDVTATYGPGRHWPSLLVVDRNGFTATDKVEVVVTSSSGAQPPDCLATTEPTVLFLPVTGARFRAFQLQGTDKLVDTGWLIDGQSYSGAQVPQTYGSGGWHHAQLTVTDEAGLTCVDEEDLAVIGPVASWGVPPRIVDPGGGAGTCGQALDAGTPVAADPANLGVTWSLAGAPDGGSVDDAGRILWTPPPGSTAPGGFVLVATNPVGSDQVAVTVPVQCDDSLELKTLCGCGSGGPAAPLLALAGLWLLARRGRRRDGAPATAACRRPGAPPR
ncbi:MAG TPA: PKD domain-containing protein, partial [Myxococcales bacterium]|nr:PKD domain-containing protein [Myxococcales bacterium]